MDCPYCGHKMGRRLDYQPLSIKRRRVLNAIIEAGPGGVLSSELMERYFSGLKKTTLRTTVYSINQAITPMKIIFRGNRAHLVKTENVNAG